MDKNIASFSHRRWAIGVMMAMIGFIAGQGCPGANQTGGGTENDIGATVHTQGRHFSPAAVTIQVGQAVRWENNDDTIHTVTSGDPNTGSAGSLFNSGSIAPGGAFEHVFDQPGTYRYFCQFHPETMSRATVIVE